MNDPLEQRLRRALAGTPEGADEQAWRAAWVAFGAACGPLPAVDAEAVAAGVARRLDADRRRRRTGYRAAWSGGAAAACAAALAVWLRPVPDPRALAWDDRLDAPLENLQWLLADAGRPPVPLDIPELGAATLAHAVDLADRWDRETL